MVCEAATIKSGLPPCVREPEAALWWLCSAFRGWQMYVHIGSEPKGLNTSRPAAKVNLPGRGE